MSHYPKPSRIHHWYKEQLKPCVDGEVSPFIYALLHLHLRRCPECRREMGELRKLGSLLQIGAREPIAPPKLNLQILKALQDVSLGKFPITALGGELLREGRPSRWRYAIVGSVCACVGLFLFVAFERHIAQSKETSNIGRGGNMVALSTSPVIKPAYGIGEARPMVPKKPNEPSTPPQRAHVPAPFVQDIASKPSHNKAAQTHRTSSSKPTLPYGNGTPEDPLRLSVAVSDLGSACGHLMGVVQRYGGAITLASKPIETAYNLPVSADPNACYLLVRLPSSYAKGFYEDLRRMAVSTVVPPPTAMVPSVLPRITFVKPSSILMDATASEEQKTIASAHSPAKAFDSPSRKPKPHALPMEHALGRDGTVVYIIRLHTTSALPTMKESGMVGKP